MSGRRRGRNKSERRKWRRGRRRREDPEGENEIDENKK